jgi:CO/xanthine dehydrogenase Mo-binding subunit
VVWDEKNYRGAAYGTYGWAACLVEVEVELATYAPRVLRLVTAEDIGTVIHPVLAAGQVEGGAAQAIGYALLEEVIMKDGQMANAQLTNYLIPTPLDTPPMKVLFKPHPYAHGPFGAKGMGELPIDGPAPAITGAIAQALGIEIDEIPATPERIWAWVEAAGTRRRRRAS